MQDNPFLDNSLLKKIQQGIQEDEEKIQELKVSKEKSALTIIEPKYYGDPEYERSLVKKVRDGSIIIKSCTGNSGSFYVIIELENSSDEDITIEMQRGQRKETSSPSQSIPKVPINVNKLLQLKVPKKSSKIFELECFCIDNHYSCPEGEDMNVAPLICVAAQDNDDQGDVWNETNKNDIYD
ncbi:hypothetical protein RFI_09468 [Reticulomyxa filosa]|uniref:Uncharacterized protein n=1 Tax=Reticulomyxa filosa TaxID=46433 RepID=X6NNS6_RETFI|nr:hypothetical protein RFI_09468 [Reticulomyxa filosa]|eukprot:ETO27666.1 hypothetical protein RFI_09468 [Reticulomyxa filosa]